MRYFTVGAYWHKRQLTLQQYADATRTFFVQLQEFHQVFRQLEWVGTRPNSAIKVNADLGNLDELIFQYAGDSHYFHTHANPDGTPSWESTCAYGYSMIYDTGRAASGGGVGVGIRAGNAETRTPSAVTISFPAVDDARFPYREFYDYAFLKKLFLMVIRCWEPQKGLVMSHAFSHAFVDEGPTHVGWLTYLRDPRAAALRHSAALSGLHFEETPDGGTLISLDTQIISPDNFAQVEKARRLRSKLIAEKIV
ncbi:MAG: Imm52 family immunity protein [Pseudomonadota bacterium]